VPPHYRHQRNEQQIKHTYRQQIFPFKIKKLIDAEAGESPAEPHNDKDEEECFAKEPQR